MITLVVLFLVSLILLWILLLYSAWRVEQKNTTNITQDLTPLYNKSSRWIRKWWFAFLRMVTKLRELGTKLATKAFFAIFPNARKAFEKKDELTGLQHGPSSYFLKSISPEKNVGFEEPIKNRRKRKNV